MRGCHENQLGIYRGYGIQFFNLDNFVLGAEMICHARRIAEEKIIDEMERRTRPLIIVVVICLLAVLVDGLIDVYAAKKYADQINTARSFAACLNGQQIEMGGSLIGCSINEIKLVKGMQK